MRARDGVGRAWRALALLAVTAGLFVGCVEPTPQVAKIGLVAPFEGRYREIGDDVIPAARLAIREWAAAQSAQAGGARLVFELVAYDDGGDPALAAEQARKLTADPDVAAVVGHWRDATTLAALPIYTNAGLPVIAFATSALPGAPGVINLAPTEAELREASQSWLDDQGVAGIILLNGPQEVTATVQQFASTDIPDGSLIAGGPDWGLRQFYALAGERAEGALYVTGAGLPVDAAETDLPPNTLAAFLDSYREGSLGAEPGPLTVAAYRATWVAMARAAEALGFPAADSPVSAVTVDESGRRLEAPIYLYRWHDAQRTLAARLR